MRDQQKMAIECQNVERMGLNVLSYLEKAYGCISPRATWQRLQLNYLGRTLKTMTDGREKKKMFTRKLTLEQKKRAVEIALEGGNPNEYLRECGSADPNSMWFKIKQDLQQVDPETYARLKDRRKKNGKAEKAVMPMPEAETPESVKMTPVKEPEAEKEPEAKIWEPVRFERMTVREVEGVLGRYRRKDVHGETYIDFESVDGLEVLSYTLDQWKYFGEELRKAGKILGVEV